MTALFEIRDLRFRDILWIQSLDILEGERLAMVGESGSGKTTLLKMMNLLLSPDSGRILYREKPLDKWDPVKVRREVVMVQQQPMIFPGNVRDNLLIGLDYSGKKPAQDPLLEEMLLRIHLNKSLEDPIEKFSGGEKQRLALGRVLLMDPQVLLLDEPSSALDEETANMVIGDTLEEARKSRITVVMVTHASSIARTWADRIITLSEGKILSPLEDPETMKRGEAEK